MRDILKLYYYGLKVNKKKFIFISILICIWVPLTISIAVFSKESFINTGFVSDFLKELNKSDIVTRTSLNKLNTIVSSKIVISDTLSAVSYIFVGLVVLLSVLISFTLVTMDYRKKNAIYLILNNLPIKIYKIKISKILVGWSIYMYCIIGFTLASELIDLFWRIYLGDIYMLSAWSLFGENSFLLTSSLSAIIISILVVLPSIIGIQSLTSILFLPKVRGKIFKKIICLTLLLACGICVFIFTLNYIISYDTFDYYTNTKMFSWFSIVIYLVSLSLAYIDCKISKTRNRGGVING